MYTKLIENMKIKHESVHKTQIKGSDLLDFEFEPFICVSWTLSCSIFMDSFKSRGYNKNQESDPKFYIGFVRLGPQMNRVARELDSFSKPFKKKISICRERLSSIKNAQLKFLACSINEPSSNSTKLGSFSTLGVT